MNANNMVKYMPIDKSSLDMISPILDFTSQGENGGGFGNTSFMNDLTNQTGGTQYPYGSGFFNKLGMFSPLCPTVLLASLLTSYTRCGISLIGPI
jgi:hypothetical protein